MTAIQPYQRRFTNIGHLWIKRRAHNAARHVVEQRDDKEWAALCTGSRAVYGYKGRGGQVTCVACRALLGKQEAA